jgi:hypothetical protein
MVNSVDQIAEQIFKTIKGFGHSIVLFTENGKKTVDPTAARRFYAKDIQMMVNFVVDETTNELVVNLSKDTDIKAVSPMLAGLRKIASRYIIEYTVKTFGKTIKPRDFSFMAKNKIEEANKPMAAKGLVSYRYKGNYGYVMIGATDHTDAKKEAERSISSKFDVNNLEVWNTKTKKYQKVDEAKMVNEPFDAVNDRYIVMAISPHWKAAHYVNTESPAAHLMKKNIKQATIMTLKQAERVAAAVEGGENQWRTEIMPLNNSNNINEPTQIDEGFSGWHGSSRRSVNELGGARIIVRHRTKVDEEKRGARTRQIQSIFIENSVGERFKFPSTNITAAKAMLRHVQEGGAPFDDFGQYIYGIMEELDQLKNFQRKNKKANFFEDETIGEEIGNHIGSLRNNLKQMAGLKGYTTHFESFSKEKHEISEDQLSELKDSVTVSYFDESISESLPYIARIIEVMRTRKDKQAEIIKFAQYVMDNRENIELISPIDDADPLNPAARKFKDPATAFSAWVNYLAPKMKDDILSNMMMAVSDTVFDIESKYLSMAAAGIKVIKQRGKVAESTDLGDEIVPLDEVEFKRIVETFDKYNVRKIFGV